MTGYLLLKVVEVVAAVAVPTLTFMGTRYLNRKWKLDVSQKEQEQIASLSREAVMAASQKYRHSEKGEDTSKKKLDEATGYLMKRAAKIGIKITKEIATGSIEAALSKRKQERGKPRLGTGGDVHEKEVIQRSRWAVGLKAAMEFQGKSIDELSPFLDVSPDTIKEWVEENRPVSYQEQLVIASWLGMPVRNLFTDMTPQRETVWLGVPVGEKKKKDEEEPGTFPQNFYS
ncbi:phage holin, LLH family [Desulfobacterales bacterium HSG2]|nr:phage holin, LLH family [Desulfobacterales bacterium HSG2]